MRTTDSGFPSPVPFASLAARWRIIHAPTLRCSSGGQKKQLQDGRIRNRATFVHGTGMTQAVWTIVAFRDTPWTSHLLSPLFAQSHSNSSYSKTVDVPQAEIHRGGYSLPRRSGGSNVAVDTEKRKGERVCTALPVALGGRAGVTRDVSASGVFFEMDTLCAVGSPVRFTVEVATPARKLILNCEGDVLRTEARDNGTGLAVRITEWTMRFS
jgi:hypothetical protein